MARDAFPKVGEQGYDTPCISDRCYLKIHTLAGPLTGVITHKGCISLVVLVSTLFHHASIFDKRRVSAGDFSRHLRPRRCGCCFRVLWILLSDLCALAGHHQLGVTSHSQVNDAPGHARCAPQLSRCDMLVTPDVEDVRLRLDKTEGTTVTRSFCGFQ